MAATKSDGKKRTGSVRHEPIILAPDADLLNVELFDEDGDIADDDQCFNPLIDLDDEDRDPIWDAMIGEGDDGE